MHDYRALVAYRTRAGKDFPLAYLRQTTLAKDATSAALMVLKRPRVVALGDLFVSVAVSRLGSPGTKA